MRSKFPIILTCCLLSFSVQHTNAQKLFFFFGHLNYEAPSNSGLMSQYKFGLGAEAGAGIRIVNKTYFTGTIGYSYFKDVKNGPGHLNYAPIRFGLRQNFLPLNILYVHADVGAADVKNNVSSGSRFNGSFGAGVKLAVLEAQIDYELMGKKDSDPTGANHWMSFKLGWRLGL